jgi:hypothetical protein
MSKLRPPSFSVTLRVMTKDTIFNGAGKQIISHIPCLTHIINLLVEKLLKTFAIKVNDGDEVADFEELSNDDTDDFLEAIDNCVKNNTDNFDTASFAFIFAPSQSRFGETYRNGNISSKLVTLMIFNP